MSENLHNILNNIQSYIYELPKTKQKDFINLFQQLTKELNINIQPVAKISLGKFLNRKTKRNITKFMSLLNIIGFNKFKLYATAPEVDLNICDSNGDSILTWVLNYATKNHAEYLIFNTNVKYGYDDLELSCYHHYVNIVREMLKRNEFKDRKQNITLFFYSNIFKNLEILELLIQHGADVNEVKSSTTVLLKAIDDNNIKIVKLLIKYNVDVNLNLGDIYPTLLAYMRSIDILLLLIEHGADPQYVIKKCIEDNNLTLLEQINQIIKHHDQLKI